MLFGGGEDIELGSTAEMGLLIAWNNRGDTSCISAAEELLAKTVTGKDLSIRLSSPSVLTSLERVDLQRSIRGCSPSAHISPVSHIPPVSHSSSVRVRVTFKICVFSDALKRCFFGGKVERNG